VVAVTSVQPTSEKRTVWQLTGSRAGLAVSPPGMAATLDSAAALDPATAFDSVAALVPPAFGAGMVPAFGVGTMAAKAPKEK